MEILTRVRAGLRAVERRRVLHCVVDKTSEVLESLVDAIPSYELGSVVYMATGMQR